MLSNRQLLEELATARGVIRVGVVLQRWPHFLSKPEQSFLGENFIGAQTVFGGPWQPAASLDPLAMDVAEISDAEVGEALLWALHRRGYEPKLLNLVPGSDTATVKELLERYGESHPDLDGVLFCYYAPTVFVASPAMLPAGAGRRSVRLADLTGSASGGGLIWSGQRRGRAQPDTILHAFIYTSLTLFRLRTQQPVWLTADSRVGGRIRPAIAECPPGPTDQDYRADPAMVQRIMLNNLRCRLWHLLPDAL